MSVPRCIFTVTTGRSGSNFLTELLARCAGVVSLHEPAPNFAHCMRHVQLHPALAKEFLLQSKLPAIRKISRGRVYVETSHLFCKGFLEAWLQIPHLPTPDLVLLHRDYRKVARSMLSLETTPARTLRGATWYLSPADPTCYTLLEGWDELHDYQLCYWYCLEIDTRKRLYAEAIRQRGGRVVGVELESLSSPDGFDRLRSELALPNVGLIGQARALLQRNRPVNTKADKKKIRVEFTSQQLDELEQEVRDRMRPNSAAVERLPELATQQARAA